MKEVLNTGEVSAFLCVLFCIPECLYICVYSCGLKVKCPVAFGTKGLLLLCMLAVSVGDKVWSWEIRSGPANETLKVYMENLPSSTSHFYFEAFCSLHDINHLSCLCIYMNRQSHTISSYQIIHLQQ